MNVARTLPAPPAPEVRGPLDSAKVQVGNAAEYLRAVAVEVRASDPARSGRLFVLHSMMGELYEALAREVLADPVEGAQLPVKKIRRRRKRKGVQLALTDDEPRRPSSSEQDGMTKPTATA